MTELCFESPYCDAGIELKVGMSGGSANMALQLRVSGGYIQWRLARDESWANLLSLAELQASSSTVIISSAQLNSNGELVFTLSDGRELNAGALDGLTAEQEAQLAAAYEHSQDALTNSEIEALIRNFTE